MARLVPFLLVISSSLYAAEPKVLKDIPYAEPQHERRMLDVYAPPEGEKHPIVFWIHGGGWEAGDKSEVELKPQAFVEKGFVFVSTNYRFVPEVTIDVMAGDIAKAIRWTYDHANEFGGDRERFFIMGHSAGAQLAALVCTDPSYLNAEKLPLSIVVGCVPVDGDTYDVPMQITVVEQRRKVIYRAKFGDEANQRKLSPVYHIGKGRGIPPFLMLHVADHPETLAQSHRLAAALEKEGIEAKAHPAEGKDHNSLNDDLGKPDDKPTAVLFAFLDRALNRRRDHKLYEGKWRATELTADGNKAPDDDARKLTVVNAADGSWTAYADGNEVSKGTSTIDPTQNPKTIDLIMTDAQGNSQTVLGIYDITESRRRLCFALPPGEARPTEFGSTAGSQHVLIEFEKIDD